MVEKGIRKGISHVIYQYVKLIASTWKIIITIKNNQIVSMGI